MQAPTAAIESDGSILLGWLQLLGWQISIGHEHGLYLGEGAYTDGETTSRISGRADSRSELAWQLYEAGCLILSRNRRGDEGLAAA